MGYSCLEQPTSWPKNRSSREVRLRGRASGAQHDGDRCHRSPCARVFSGQLGKTGRTLLVCGARQQPARMLAQAEFIDHLGKENILPHVQAGLQRARKVNTTFEGLGKEIAADLERAAL
jgi:hypothetical protein